MSIRITLLPVTLLAFGAMPAGAENLHQKFGPGWDCGYITTGVPYKDTCKACEQRGMEFDRVGETGTCVPKGGGTPPESKPSAPLQAITPPRPPTPNSDVNLNRSPPTAPATSAPAPRPRRFNAIAGTTHKTNDGVRVSIGYAEAYSADEAKSKAVEQCKINGVPGCKAIGAWSVGCVYITTGKGGGGNVARAGWASGATKETATAKCRSSHSSCKEPIGGCVD